MILVKAEIDNGQECNMDKSEILRRLEHQYSRIRLTTSVVIQVFLLVI